MDDAEINDILAKCRIWNSYIGLDELRTQLLKEPSQALRIIWPFMVAQEDPGNDDCQLCILLVEILTEAAGRQVVEALVLAEWPRLSDAIRRNIVVVASSAKAMSVELATKLFNHPDTRPEQRHRIVAGLAAGDDRPGREACVVDLAKRIGSYADPERQATLDKFVASVVQNYS